MPRPARQSLGRNASAFGGADFDKVIDIPWAQFERVMRCAVFRSTPIPSTPTSAKRSSTSSVLATYF